MKRVLQIGMLVVMAVFLAEMFTPLQLGSCETHVDKKATKTLELQARGVVGGAPAVAFQVHGGDVAFGDGLRAAFKDELARRMPQAKYVDGPPGKDAVLLRMTLTAADRRWTPVYSHEALSTHTTIQLPGTKATSQITADADVDAVCKGLVSRGRFQAHADTLAPFATWLVDQLAQAKP